MNSPRGAEPTRRVSMGAQDRGRASTGEEGVREGLGFKL
jgi:hypothetical protein